MGADEIHEQLFVPDKIRSIKAASAAKAELS